jgi:hypothetical protein
LGDGGRLLLLRQRWPLLFAAAQKNERKQGNNHVSFPTCAHLSLVLKLCEPDGNPVWTFEHWGVTSMPARVRQLCAMASSTISFDVSSNGNRSRNVVPLPSTESKSIDPLCICMTLYVIANPMPLPLFFVVKYR